jgi:hypothetical protein
MHSSTGKDRAQLLEPAAAVVNKQVVASNPISSEFEF